MLKDALMTADQRGLWNGQHATRGAVFENGSLQFTPNKSAVEFAGYLSPRSKILEVGAANGRDARYWASLGHHVAAVDFSPVALQQLSTLAEQQKVSSRIIPVMWDINKGRLPIHTDIDAFYARSALHVDDETMLLLAKQVDAALVPGGIVMIEGKGPGDRKIARSDMLGNGLAVDPEEGGHLRRVWTDDFAQQMCDTLNWDIVQLKGIQESWQGVTANFMRLIARKKDRANRI